ncbi:MAG: hypothetical protein ACLFUB_11545 [Cyclobacteriaceae bacterium]
MNRKKILICLNGQDDAHLESSFIDAHMPHSRNLIMKFQMESIMNDAYEEAYVQANPKPAFNNQNGHSKDFNGLVDESRDIHEAGKVLQTSKRQMIISSSVKELITESNYSDLLIIRSKNFYASCMYYGQKKPIHEILKKTGCPVLVIPDETARIEQMLLVFDGSPLAFYSIRSLKTTLPMLCSSIPITVLIACSDATEQFSSYEEKLLIEYLRLHFKDVGVHKVCEESIHTIHFAVDPTQKLMIVSNNQDQKLPDFVAYELDELKQAQDFHFFQFILNSLPR